MKRLITSIVLAAAAASLAACDGGGGGISDTQGAVIDKRSGSGVYELKIDGVIAHGRTIWWESVTQRVYSNCQVGETWDKDNSSGCS